MASIISEMKREAITTKWIVLIFLGASVNSVLWSQYLFFSQQLFSDITVLAAFSLLYAVAIILFSIVSSLSLPEKRFVAPSDIQLASFAFITLIGFVTLHTQLASYIITLIFSFLFLYVLGLIQDTIVIKVIGVYGKQENCWFGSYLAALPFDNLSKKLKDEDFSVATGISKSSYINEVGIAIFYTPTDVGYQVFLVLKKKPNDETSSLLNVVSYERTKYGIRSSKSCYYQTQMIIHLLSKLSRIKKAPKDDYFYAQSVDYALKPTKNKLESERIDIRIMLACMIACLIALPIIMFLLGYIAELKDLVAVEIPMVVAILVAGVTRVKK